jgi:hypothetical protein
VLDVSAQTRFCKGCEQPRPVDAFYVNKKSDITGRCKICISERDQQRYSNDPEKFRAKAKRLRQTSSSYRLMRKSYQDRWLYGVDGGFRERLWAAQYGCCAICRSAIEVETACIDHDHVTGQVRSLLCRLCNAGLGIYKESPELLRAAATYLESWKGNRT